MYETDQQTSGAERNLNGIESEQLSVASTTTEERLRLFRSHDADEAQCVDLDLVITNRNTIPAFCTNHIHKGAVAINNVHIIANCN